MLQHNAIQQQYKKISTKKIKFCKCCCQKAIVTFFVNMIKDNYVSFWRLRFDVELYFAFTLYKSLSACM
uniref:Uncharacterized protein n=1 Tax=Anguilla anguilla TaxID=7936 RepID=A0A0E9QPM9_ANGAN